MKYYHPYLTTRTKTNEHHRSHFIIHLNYQFHFAEFNTGQQFDAFADAVGIRDMQRLEYIEDPYDDSVYQKFALNINAIEEYSFWNTEELPDGAKAIQALSNGSIVTCYYLNDGTTLKWYRPNPNNRDVYKPLPLDQHISHVRLYGLY